MIVYMLSAFSAIVAIELCRAEELPVSICTRNSPNYSNCLKLAIQESWPRFLKGLPEFNFPPLDPLLYKFGKYEIDRGEIHATVIFNNVIVTGLTNNNVLAVRAHFLDDVFRLEIDAQISRLFFEGDCEAEGTVGGFRLGRKGYFNVTMEDVKGTNTLTGHVANDTLIVEHIYILPSVGNFKVYLNNFFGGNKELNDLGLYFVNENWPILLRVALPTLSEVWDPWLSDLANRLFSKVSFSKLFP